MSSKKSNSKIRIPTEKEITDLLLDKHVDDIAVPQCKTGRSWGGRYLIMDFWAAKKSWANPLAVAYEIKRTRGDFLQDNKWHHYLEYCNQFYFVTPGNDIIKPEEIPPEVGLMKCTKNVTRLYTKKKAPYREIEISQDLYMYLLMSRTVVTRENPCKVNSKDYWEKWLRDKTEDDHFGHMVSKRLKKRFDEQVEKVRVENKRLVKENEKLANIKKMLEENGIRTASFMAESQVEKMIKEINSEFDMNLHNKLKYLHKNIGDVVEFLDKKKGNS